MWRKFTATICSLSRSESLWSNRVRHGKWLCCICDECIDISSSISSYWNCRGSHTNDVLLHLFDVVINSIECIFDWPQKLFINLFSGDCECVWVCVCWLHSTYSESIFSKKSLFEFSVRMKFSFCGDGWKQIKLPNHVRNKSKTNYVCVCVTLSIFMDATIWSEIETKQSNAWQRNV